MRKKRGGRVSQEDALPAHLAARLSRTRMFRGGFPLSPSRVDVATVVPNRDSAFQKMFPQWGGAPLRNPALFFNAPPWWGGCVFVPPPRGGVVILII